MLSHFLNRKSIQSLIAVCSVTKRSELPVNDSAAAKIVRTFFRRQLFIQIHHPSHQIPAIDRDLQVLIRHTLRSSVLI
jgi:hypothetical protein